MDTRIAQKEISKGKHNDKVYWACGFLVLKPGKNAYVHLKPGKVIVKEIYSGWGGKRYDGYTFDKKGNQTNKSISLDGDDSVYYLYENELDCIEKYSELTQVVLKDFEEWWEKKKAWADKKINEYKKNIR